MSKLSAWSSDSINQLFYAGSSSNNNSNNLYSLLSERSSIKSGAYKQTLKAYYSTQGTSAAGSASKSSGSSNVLDKILESKKKPAVSKQTQEANAALNTSLSSLKSSISALQSDSTYADADGNQTAESKVSSAMKAFVKQYNNTVTASKDSNLQSKTANVASMMRSTAANEDKLAEIGVTVDRDGTLMLDENKLKSADVSKVQDLFAKDNITSYGSTIASRVGYATAAGSSNQTSIAEKVATKTDTASGAAGLKEDAKALGSNALYSKVKDADGNETGKYDVSNILSKVKSFADNYNKMFDAAKSSTNSGVTANLARIQENTSRNANALKEFGIHVDRTGKMSVDEDAFQKADMSRVQKLFQDYGSAVSTSASLVNYYMGTQADASNGYTSDAAYNLLTGATYTTTM